MSMYPRMPEIRSTLPGTCTIACDVWPGEEDDIYAHAPICRKEYIGHLEVALAAERSQLAALIAALESRASELEQGTLFGPVAAMSIRSVLARVAPAAGTICRPCAGEVDAGQCVCPEGREVDG